MAENDRCATYAVFVLTFFMMVFFLILYLGGRYNIIVKEEKKIEFKKIYPNALLGNNIIFVPLENADILLIDRVMDKANMFCSDYHLGQVSENGIWFFVN